MRPPEPLVERTTYECPNCLSRREDPDDRRCPECGAGLVNISRSRDC